MSDFLDRRMVTPDNVKSGEWLVTLPGSDDVHVAHKSLHGTWHPINATEPLPEVIHPESIVGECEMWEADQ